VGNPLQNSRRQINLLAQNLSELYRNPLNDENLKLQYQCTVNLSKFLSEHKGLLPELYSDLFNGNHHFTMSQPMMASLLLVGFLQQFRLFHEKDIEMLFITSYLKDIGMSFIPEEKLDQKDLELHDKKIISRHADNSISLLEGRTPLARNHLNIIKNHHFLNKKIQAALSGIKTDSSQNSLMGLETEMVAVMDVLVAMINDRPYRAGQPLFQSLELLSKVMADDYPSEFKALVNYLRYFFTKMSA
jgi:DNA-binding transcriptional MerR regulator